MIKIGRITGYLQSRINRLTALVGRHRQFPSAPTPYGLAHIPPQGSFAYIAQTSSRDNAKPVAFLVTHAQKPEAMKEGDVAIYSNRDDSRLEVGTHRIQLFAEDGAIIITAGGSQVKIGTGRHTDAERQNHFRRRCEC